MKEDETEKYQKRWKRNIDAQTCVLSKERYRCLPSPTLRFVFEFDGSSPPVKLPVEPQPEKTNTRTLKPR